jgi:3-deoxy-manno-octulosonate cytidylyltransferase (CMP-KDO synthetase)
MSFKVVIPARFASTRLPGKPLLDIAGKPMIQHVYERAQESGATDIIIATDNQQIQQVALSFGAEVCLTRDDHPSGTDRLAEVAAIKQFNDDDIIINVQGDEPCLPAELINQVANDLAQYPQADMASLYSKISDEQQLFDLHCISVERRFLG